ncbi:hypothetical protein H3Z85_00535 [Chryseobacterium indologenes]|uniref:Uncharacterized protein n=3 Tax=Chryseobacterium TaxID=59732 RepID=A0A3G6RIV9_CHRLC|nr:MULTISPECIES: hypothetical protein [Bacteroidota]AZA84523.1 hypothetical protein EG342_22670 [Chryseobacterium lactis]AZB04911.1 hypothetical protein EG341_13550 [Chryseobacterium lactis]KMQ64392.1 hypothetical protein ACM46_08900 [Chryseobacterium angstadtii]MBF6643674.1 hypothetical protein [Chryseobacterium indologenes]PNW14642.1 hypothetical protein C1637_06700 [Chryseobacterium lactis]
MNTYLLALVESTLKDAIEEFSKLHWVSPAFHANKIDVIQLQLNKLMDYYIEFFQKTGFLPKDLDLVKKSCLIERRIKDFDKAQEDEILSGLSFVIEEIEDDVKNRIIPIHTQYPKTHNLALLTGIAATDSYGKTIRFLLHEFEIPRILIDIIAQDLDYIGRLLDLYDAKVRSSLKDFVTSFNRNYKKFQKDCKIYLEDTFYQFYIKLKMIGANRDILFSDMNKKEIAYNNQFGDYLNLYRIYNQHYKIVLDDLPRFKQIL